MCDVAQQGEYMNTDNLVPNHERTPEELREMGRKGGIASGEARRKKRDALKLAKLWLVVFEDIERKDKAGADKVRKELIKWYMK